MSATAQEQHFLLFHLNLLNAFVENIQQQPPFNSDICSENDRSFLQALTDLCSSSAKPDFLAQGQELMCKVVTQYPHLMPLLYRDLLWFFGGDCLHFMPDDEISQYQQLDELRYAANASGDDFSYENARARILGMH